MNFHLTSFFSDLDEPIPLVPSMSITLENLSAEEERNYVRRLFGRAVHLDGRSVRIIPGVAAHASWPSGLEDLRQQIAELPDDEDIPGDLGRELLDQLALEAAQDLVVCRFDDGGRYEQLKQEYLELPEGAFFMLKSDDDLPASAKRSYQICNLIGLLVDEGGTDSGGVRKSFLLDDSIDWSVHLGEQICDSILHQSIVRVDDRGESGFQFADLDFYRDDLVEIGGLLDSRLGREVDESRLFYAAELVSIATHATDVRTAIVNLVGLLELLLARNPDTSRFNVEDSLTKQFILKVGTALHWVDPSRDLDKTRMALKDLYSVRSAIAHGDFAGLPKKLERSAFAEPPDSETYMFTRFELELDHVRSFADECARATLLLTLREPEYAEFLKKG